MISGVFSFWTVFGLVFFFGTAAVDRSVAHAAEDKTGRQTEWDKTLQAARQEGQVVLYTARDYDVLFGRYFQKRYPEIKVSGVITANTPGVSQRILAERRAGRYLWDLYIGGASTGYSMMYKGKVLDPIRPALMLPEVTDESKWWGGRHEYIDEENRYLFAFNGMFEPYFSYNTKAVDPREFSSLWDLLQPKWKGRIVMFDPTQPGSSSALRFLYHHPELGPRYLRRLFTEMDLVMSRDLRQLGDWLASGKYAVCIFMSARRLLERPKAQGLPVDWFGPKAFKEGAILAGGSGQVGLINRAPHPNAAKVAINWLLSREGQLAYQKVLTSPDSRRIDISKDDVPPDSRRMEGVRYMVTESAEWMDLTPVLQFVNEVWKPNR
jgi:iron(III) transport system substrate-binding protein